MVIKATENLSRVIAQELLIPDPKNLIEQLYGKSATVAGSGVYPGTYSLPRTDGCDTEGD